MGIFQDIAILFLNSQASVTFFIINRDCKYVFKTSSTSCGYHRAIGKNDSIVDILHRNLNVLTRLLISMKAGGGNIGGGGGVRRQHLLMLLFLCSTGANAALQIKDN